jgi:hypothetical protein
MLNVRKIDAGLGTIFGEESGGIGVINDRRQPPVSLRGNRTITGTELKDFRRPAFEPV